MNADFIRINIRQKTFYITYHAYLAMIDRNINRTDMLKALYYGKIIERNPDSKPYPSFLVLGRSKNGDPIHIKCSKAVFGKKLRIVTVYEPGREEWEMDCKTRREKR